MKNVMIETRTVTGTYEISCDQAIVATHKYGRVLVTQGLGGSGLDGETYRWEHGLAVQLLPTDCFEFLDGDYNPTITIMDAALAGHDDDRSLLPFTGVVVESIAQSAGVEKRTPQPTIRSGAGYSGAV